MLVHALPLPWSISLTWLLSLDWKGSFSDGVIIMTQVRMTHMFFLLNLGHAWMNKAKFYQLIFVSVYLNMRLIGDPILNQSFNFFFSKPMLQAFN